MFNMNQTNSILFRKDRLWALALGVLAVATTAFFLSVAPAHAADGDSASITLRDTNGNAKINRITFNIANAAAGTWQLNGSAPYGLSVTDDGSGNGVTVSAVSFTTSASATTVGIQVDLDESDADLSADTSVSAVEMIYTQVTGDGSCTNCIRDNGSNLELNGIATGDSDATDTEVDGAAPVIGAAAYDDADDDGKIDSLLVAFSESVVLTSTLSANDLVFTDVGDFTGMAFGGSTADLITGTVESVTVTLGTEATVVDTGDASGTIAFSTQNDFSLVDSTGNTNTTLKAQSHVTSVIDSAEVLLTSVVFSTSSGLNTLAFGYSEPVVLANGTTSTVGRGALTSAGTISGMGDFATNGDAVTNAAGDNSIAGSGTATLTVSFASQLTGYWVSTSTTAPSGTVTPLAHTDIADETGNNVNTLGPAVTPSTSTAWDLTRPTVSSIAFQDAAGNNGKIDAALITFSEDIRDNSLTNGNGVLGATGTTGGSFATGTANDEVTTFNRTVDDAAVDTDAGADSDFTYTGATTLIRDTAGNLLGSVTTAGTIDSDDVTETDATSPILTAIALSNGSGRNVITLTYSEGVAIGGNGASSALSGDLTTAGTLAGFGSFATAGDVVVPTTLNTRGGNGSASITITLADQAGGYLTGSTGPSGNFTPVASALVVDTASNQVNSSQAAVAASGAGSWDLTQPTISSVTVSDESGDNGKIDQAIIVFTEAVRDSNITNANGAIGGVAGTFTTGTANDDTTTFNVTSDTSVSVDTSAEGVDFTYSGSTTKITDSAGNLLNTTTDGVIVDADVTQTDNAAPIIISAAPSSAGTLIPATANFTMTFSETMETFSGAASGSTSIDGSATVGSATFTLTTSGSTITADPSGSSFSAGATVTITLHGDTNELEDSAGVDFNPNGTVFGNIDSATDTTYTFSTLTSSGGGGGGGGGGSSSVSVVSDSVVVTSPNGGEVLTGGSQHTITWSSTGNVNNVMLYYSVDGGSAFGLIAAGTDNDGSYTWNVPNTATGSALVKIVGRDAGGATLATDQSNANFTITANSALPVAEAPTGSGDVAAPSGSMSRADAEAVLPNGIDVDDLVRVADDGDATTDFDSTVYYVGLDAKRHPFVNSQVFFTWYENFDAVRVIDNAVLTQITLGSPVLTRPGTMMVKIQSDPRTFAVTPGDYTIRWVPSEEVAVALFGSTWNQRIMDIEPTYWSRFTMGSDLTADQHPAGSVIKTADGTKYYFDGTSKRVFASDDAFSANMFQEKYVINSPASVGWMNATAGAVISGFEDALFSLQR